MSYRTVGSRILLGGWVFAAAAGCGAGPTQPDAVERSYVLQSLNQSALPYDHEGLGCCTYLSGQLLLEQGQYTISFTARNRNTGVTFTASEWGSYALDLPAITFTPDGFTLQPLLLDVGVLVDDRIAVAFGGEGPGSPDQFQAVFTRTSSALGPRP